jgi:hypothetical protein
MKAPEVAITAKRNSGFWIAGLTAFFLAVVSWTNRIIVAFFNQHLFHAGALDDRGWWLYVVLRLFVASFLLWTIVRFPTSEGRVAKRNGGDAGKSFFDPLMGLRAFACFLVVMVTCTPRSAQN